MLRCEWGRGESTSLPLGRLCSATTTRATVSTCIARSILCRRSDLTVPHGGRAAQVGRQSSLGGAGSQPPDRGWSSAKHGDGGSGRVCLTTTLGDVNAAASSPKGYTQVKSGPSRFDGSFGASRSDGEACPCSALGSCEVGISADALRARAPGTQATRAAISSTQRQ